MKMTDKFFGALGLCRRAKCLAIGHDDVKNAVKSRKTKLVLLTNDASERLKGEMHNLNNSLKIIRVEASMSDMQLQVGTRAGIYAVTDARLEDLVLSTIKEDS